MYLFNNKAKRLFIYISMLFISILYTSCNSSDDEDKNNANSYSESSFVDTIDLATNDSNGNFNILNTSEENFNFVISDSKKFFDANFIKKIHSGSTSVMINISNLDGVVRFFAIKEDDLRKYETTKDIPDSEIITSIDFDTNFGGTWNPFGVPSTVSKKGAIFVNNYTDSILLVIPENQNNSPEGRINRGQKNVKVPFLIGTNFVYFIDVSTGSIIEYHEIFVSYQSSPYINVGKPDSYPVEPGILQIFNNTNKIYSVQNMITDQYLINNDCNCTDVGPNTTGMFEINPGVIQLLLTNINSSSITSEFFNVSESQVVNLTIQNNAISINPIINNAPTSNIIKPENQSSFIVNDNILFEGLGNDTEDGLLESNSLIWSSSIDGEIGYGKTLTKNNLSTGTHIITLTAHDSNEAEGIYTITIYISPNLPSSPLNLKATPGNSDILITWNYVEAATSYKIYWSNEPGVSKTNNAGFFLTELNLYNHHNLQNGIKYYYVVTSINNFGEGVESLEINATINNAPTPTITKPENQSSFTVNDNILFEGLGYDTEDGLLESNSLIWSSSIDGEIGYGKTLTKNNLSTGTHIITLTAHDSNEAEGISTITIYISPNLPSSPLNLKAKPGNSDILITWTYVEAATSYKIYWSNEPGVSKTNNAGFFLTELNSYNHHNLKNGIKYYYVVTSINNFGEGVESLEINAILNNVPIPTIIKPENQSSFTVNDNILFEGLGNDTEDGLLESNSLIWSSSIDGEIGYGKTLTKNNLSTGTHIITLTARDSNDAEGIYTITIYISPNLPSSPLNLKAKPGNSDILITWNYVEAALSYTIYWSNEPGVSKTNNAGFFSTELNSYNHNNLHNGIKYFYIVTSKNIFGESVESMEINATPFSDPSPSNNDSPDDATKINFNQEYQENISSRSDVDYFKFQIYSPGNIVVKLSHETIMSSTATYWKAYLYNENTFDSHLNSLTLKGSNRISTFQEGLPIGTYYIKVTDISYSSDNYYLTIEFEPSDLYEKSPNDSIATATEIDLNKEYTGNISSSSDIDYYKFILNKSDTVTISLSHETLSASTATYWKIFLYGEDDIENAISTLTLKGSEKSSYLQEYLTPGNYYIKLKDISYDPDQYHLQVD